MNNADVSPDSESYTVDSAYENTDVSGIEEQKKEQPVKSDNGLKHKYGGDKPSSAHNAAESLAAGKFNSAEFAEAWRKTLARVSSEKSFYYDIIVNCKLMQDGSGSAVLVAKDKFFANRVAYVIAWLGETMSGFLGRKIEFTVTHGQEKLSNSLINDDFGKKNAQNNSNSSDISQNSQKNVEKREFGNIGSVSSRDENPVKDIKTEKKAVLNENSANIPENEDDYVPLEGGEEAEMADFEDAPPAAESMRETVSSYNDKDRKKNAEKKTDSAVSQPKPDLRHEAARLEFVPLEEAPGEFAVLKEVFGQGITRINKVL